MPGVKGMKRRAVTPWFDGYKQTPVRSGAYRVGDGEYRWFSWGTMEWGPAGSSPASAASKWYKSDFRKSPLKRPRFWCGLAECAR